LLFFLYNMVIVLIRSLARLRKALRLYQRPPPGLDLVAVAVIAGN
jgi:hypothetical protein